MQLVGAPDGGIGHWGPLPPAGPAVEGVVSGLLSTTCDCSVPVTAGKGQRPMLGPWSICGVGCGSCRIDRAVSDGRKARCWWSTICSAFQVARAVSSSASGSGWPMIAGSADSRCDSLVSGGDAVPCGRESVGEVGDQLGGTCVVDGLVGELFELAAGLVVGGRDRVVPLAGLPGGTEPGGLVGVFGGGQPLGVLVEREGDLRHGGRVGDRAAS